MYLGGSPKLSSGDALASKLSQIQHRIKIGQRTETDLVSLFTYLIDSCINQAPAKEQNVIARVIEPLFTTAVESDPSTYNFLNPRIPTPRSSKMLQKNTSKCPREESVKNKNTPMAKRTVNLKKQRCVAQPSTSTAAARDSIGLVKPCSSANNSSFGIATRRSQSLSESSVQLGPSARRSFGQDDSVQRLLKAIELTSDDLCTILLCKIVHGYIFYCKVIVSQRRLRRMVRLDAANYCLRAMRSQIAESNPSPLRILAIDSIVSALMEISVKDRKFSLKIRISGMLSILTNRLLEADRLFCTVTLLRLTSRSLRSPRNAQLVGRERRFAERFVAMLNTLSATAMAGNMANEEDLLTMNDGNLPREEYLKLQGRSNDQEDDKKATFTSTNSLKIARMVEILFFVSKNKKNRTQLLEQEVIGVLKTIFEQHFEHRQEGAVHLEITLITLASIRQLSRTKKGKDQLMVLEVLEMCKSCILKLTEDRKKMASRPKLLLPYAQLQDSLCALCMRFLPQLPFPLSQYKSYPLQFTLPSLAESSCTPIGKSSTRQKRRSASPQKKTANSKFIGEAATAKLDGAHASSDEGGYEEDEAFFYYNNSDQMDDTDGHANFSDGDLDEDGENPCCSAERKSAANLDGLSPSFNVAYYSRQNLDELRDNYRHLFSEFEQGALGIGNQSPKMRKTHASTSSSASHKETLQKCANTTLSVGKFIKIAYPEMFSPEQLNQTGIAAQPFLQSTESMRDMIVQEIPQSRLQSSFQRRVVFDLDKLIGAEGSSCTVNLSNLDLDSIGRLDPLVDHLKFESRFESGNLRQAIQVSENHYELILSPDINQHSAHFQWFYFQVSNNRASLPYTFEVINCLKNTSMFSRGMQPVMFSVSEAKQGWVRTASSVSYYRNLYSNEEEAGDKQQTPSRHGASSVKQASRPTTKEDSPGVDNKGFFSARFTINFAHQADICYIAYHFPYTYSYLRASLESFVSRCACAPNIYVRSSPLTQTLAGNDVPIVTVTAHGSAHEVEEREIVLLSARVHPGESNASWIMQGILHFLSSDGVEARQAREAFVFKIIPMLNPDGVINGSHRCSLAGVDLNRMWDRPSQVFHPTTFHAKGLIQYMADVLDKPPWMFVDLHGHSRRPNIFLYGNNPEESWRPSDHSIAHNYNFLGLPDALEKIAAGFSLRDCRFSVSKSKEFSARIAVWRQFGLQRAYTMEATYCGFDLGPMAGKQIRIIDLNEMGMQLCQALLQLQNTPEGNDLYRLQYPKQVGEQTSGASPLTAKNKTARKSVVEVMELGQQSLELAGMRLLPRARKSLSFNRS